MLLPSNPPPGPGIYLIEPAGGDPGGMVTWRSGGGPALEDDSDLDLEFALDLGVDIYFRRGWGIRLGGTLVEREAVAVGIIF